jgi:glycosyltransferase involved in cell wall biosynthesis
MKTAVFFDGYAPFHETKDPALITIGLSRLGCVTTLVTEKKTELDGYRAQFPIVTADKRNFSEVDFWRQVDADLVICYTWLGQTYSSIVAAIRRSGKKVLVKADSDGRLGYPVVPRYQHQHLMATLPLKLRLKYLKVKGIIEQIEMASSVLIESPKAYENVQRFLQYWNRPSLISKLHVVPNPVTDDISKGETRTKKDILISVGRWEDSRAKNTSTMLKCASRILEMNRKWQVRLIGSGTSSLRKKIDEWDTDIRHRTEMLGVVPHIKIPRLLSDSRIFFLPSNWEGSSIAAAEAVCMGCTIVGTPLESLDFLVANGLSGTLAEGFKYEHLIQALRSDTTKHEQGTYDPLEIASYWRPKLSIRNVASQIRDVATL